MNIDPRVKVAAAVGVAYLLGDYIGTVRARKKQRNIINYYERELLLNAFSADAMKWAKDNVNKLTADEFKRGLSQRFLLARVVVDANSRN